MSEFYLFAFIFTVQVIFVLAETNVAKYNHDDLRVSDDDPKSGDLTKSPTGDRVESTPIHPEWRSDNSQYYESAEKDTRESLSDFDDLDDLAVSRDADSQDILDDILDTKDFDRNGNKENKRDISLAPLSRTEADEQKSKDVQSNSKLNYIREFKLSGRRNMDGNDEQKPKESDDNSSNLDYSRELNLSERSHIDATDEQKSKDNTGNDRFLDYSRELKLPGNRRMDSVVSISRAESGGSGSVNHPTLLPNTFPVYSRQFGNFAPFHNQWRMPITLTYPTTRFSSVLNNRYNFGTSTTSRGPTSSQDYTNNYPYMGNREFGFHPFHTRRTLF